MAHVDEITIAVSIRDNNNLTTNSLWCERAAKVTYSLFPAI
jgi:hypothetical protein